MKHQAIRNTHPEAWSIITDEHGDHAFDKDGNPIVYDKVIVQQEVDRLNQEALNNQYKLLRAKEYPSLKDFADAMYWASQGDDSKLQDYYSAISAVKEKYPKGE